MRKGLQGKRNSIINNSLKSLLLFVGLFVFGGNAAGQNPTICAGNTYTGTFIMDELGVPPGQRESGSFILNSTIPAGGTLVIDDSAPSNEDAVISGFEASYAGYIITYSWGGGATQKREETFDVIGAVPTVTLSTNPSNGSTICEGDDIELVITLSGATGYYNVQVTTDHFLGNQTYNLESTIAGESHPQSFTLNADATFEITSVVDDSGSGCNVDPAILPGPVSFNVLPNPVQQPTSGTSVCAPSNLAINLNNSEAGVEYYVLYDDGSTVSEVAGTRWTSVGGSHNFSGINEGNGQYWIAADGCNGRVNMLNGPFAISPAPSNAYSITSPTPSCAGTSLTTDGSETGVEYYVVRTSSGLRTGAMLPGTGAGLNFGGINTADTYKIEAEPENGGCVVTLGGSLQIVAPPQNHTLTATGTEYCSTSIPNTGIDLYFPTSQSGVTYTLQRWDGSNYVNVVGAPTVSGTGGLINPAWSDLQDGTYRAVATTNLAGCTRNMPGTPTVIENDPPIATLTIQADNEKCFASGEVFEIDVSLTGNAPFSFEVVNTTTNTTVATVAGSNDTDYTFSVNPTAINTHTYAIINLEDGSSCAPVANAGQVDFEVYDLPTISFSSSTGVSIDPVSGNASSELCDGSNITLTGSSSNTTGVYTYRWSNSNVAGTIGSSASITESPNSTVTYNVEITDGNSCSNDRDIEVIVNPLPILSFNPPDGSRVCSNEGLVSLVPTGTHTGGTFSGTNVDAASASFDPVAAGVGWHDVIYEATDGEGCTNSVTNRIRVNDPPTLVPVSGLSSDYCANVGSQTIIYAPNDLPGNPTWTVDGIFPSPSWFVDNGDGSATFDVGAALTAGGEQGYNFIYEYTNDATGCTNTISESTYFHDDLNNDIDFYWREAGSADPWQVFPTPDLVLCETSTDIELKAYFSPTGGPVNTSSPVDHLNGTGTFTGSGNGVTDGVAGEGTFSAATAGNGNHTITYSYTDLNNCNATVSYSVQIGTTLQFSGGLANIYCSSDNTTYTISAEPTDIAVSDGGVLNLYRADLTTYATETPIVTIEELQVDGTPNGTVPEMNFTPSIVGPDTYVFEYIYDYNGCENSIVREVLIPDVLITTFDTDPPAQREFCINDGLVSFLPTTTGGSYAGNGVSGDRFSPSAAGVGIHDVTYSINTGGCYSESTIQLTVHDPSVGIALSTTDFCQNDEAIYPVEATNLTISGGVYAADPGFETSDYIFSAPTACFYRLDGSGNPDPTTYQTSYTVSDGDNPIYFDPSEAPVGTFDILLDFDDTADGSCLITETLEVTVTATPSVNFGTTDPLEFCQNSSPVIFEGRYAGGGATGSGYFMIGSPGNPTAPGIDNLVDGAGTDNNGRAEFDPSLIAASSAEQITYVYEQSGCTSTRTKEFNIRPAPTVFDVTPATPDGGIYCHGGDATIGLSSSEEGVTYELLRDGNPVPGQTHVVNIGDPETSFNFTPVTDEGTYQIRAFLTALPPGGCVSLMNGSVEVRENKVTAVVDYKINPTCNGALDGEIHVSASSLSSDFTYTLTDVATNTWTSSTGEFTGLGDETYTINIVDGYGCPLAEALSTVELEEPDAITLTSDPATVNHVTCYGGNDGSFRVTATNVGSGNYQFSIDNGITWLTNGTSQYTFTNLYAGSYDVQVRDAGNTSCVQSLATPVVIDEPDGLVTIASSSFTNVDCTTKGEIQVEAAQAGHVGGFNYVLYREVSGGNWVQVDQSPTTNDTDGHAFVITVGGDYRVDIFGQNNCSTSGYYTVTAPTSQPVVNLVAITNESTPGAGDGSIEISITGGVAPFNFVWEDAASNPVGGNTATLMSLSAGTYSVRVTDGNGCFDELLNLVVSDNDNLDFTVYTKDPGPCYGNNDGEITLTATGGVLPYASITLTNSSGDVIPPSNSGDTYANYTGLVAGNYTATVEDGQPLTYSETITLTQNPELVLDFSKLSDATCFGNDGEVTFDASGGVAFASGGDYRFTIIPDVGAPIPISANSGDWPDPNLPAGNYELQVLDAVGCSQNLFFEITEPDDITFNVENVQDVDCFGELTGEITVSVSGRPSGTDYAFTWEEFTGTLGTDDLSDPANWAAYAGSVDARTISGLPADAYRVIATDGSCSGTSGPIIVDQSTVLDLHVENETHVTTCNGESTGSVRLSVTGGTGLYIINYGTVSDSWDGLNDYTVTGLSAGTYSFEVVDDNGCSSTESVTITEPDPFSVSVIDYGIECDDLTSGYVNFNVSGGLDDGAGNYTYHVRLVRQENNQVYINNDVTVAAQPATISSDALIAGVDKLIEGTYTLQVYDSNSTNPANCLFETQFSLENITIEDTLVHPTCSGQDNGSIDITVNGGSGNFIYTWTASAGGTVPPSQVNSEDLSDLSPGTYDVVVEDLDESNCTVTESYTIAYTNTLAVTATATDVSCFNSSDGVVTATATGGVAPYDYIWERLDSPGPPVVWTTLMNSQTLDPVGIGDYRVNIIDANGCTVQSSVVTVDRPDDFSLTIDPASVTDVSCNGGNDGSFTVTPDDPSGNYEYSIDGGATWQLNETFSGLSAGGYQVSMRDRDTNQPYCTKYDVEGVVITEPTALVVDLVEIVPVSCKDGSDGEIEVNVPVSSGSGGNSFEWFRVTTSGNIGITPAGTDERPTGLSVGDYRVRVTDVEGCQVWSEIYEVTEPATSPTITVENRTNVTTAGGNDGSIEISVTGGTGIYTFDWEEVDNLGAQVDDLSSHPDDNSNVINGISAGRYRVTVLDGNSCPVNQTIPITDPNTPLALDTATVSPHPCNDAVNGEIRLIASGGQAPYTFTLTRQPGTKIDSSSISGGFAYYNNLEPGYYNAQVEDDNGVVQTVNNIHLTVPDPVVLTVTKDNDATCFGVSDGQITIQVAGGTPFPGDSDPLDTSVPDEDYYSYTINPGNGSAISGFVEDDGTGSFEIVNSSLGADNYEIAVADGNYCSNVAIFTITQPNELTINRTDKKDVTCFNGNNGSLTVAINGRPAGTSFTYVWEVDADKNGTWVAYPATTGTLTNLEAGYYRVTAEEAITNCPVPPLTIEIDEPAEVVLTQVAKNNVTTCNGDNSGSVRFSVIGGTAPYTIKYGTVETSWDGTGDFTATGLTAGFYDFEVFDVNGCSDDIQDVEITEPAPLQVTNFDYGILCQNLTSGWLTFDVAGGVDDAGFRYDVRLVRQENNQEYYNNIETASPVNISSLIEGTYTLEVFDANSTASDGCLFTDTFNLENVSINATLVHPTCVGQDNGSIELSVSGGSGNYSYSWDNGETTKDIYDVAPGTYELTFSQLDGAGVAQCSFTEQYELFYQNTLSVNATATDVTCFNSTDGSVTATATGGVAPYDYIWQKETPAGSGTWTTLMNSQTLDPVGIGNYRVNIQDINGCTIQSSEVTVDRPDDFSLMVDPASVSNVSCNGDGDGSFTVTPILHPGTGSEIIDPDPATINFEYSIDGGTTWQINPVFDGLAAGLYAVSMRDLDTKAPYCTKLDIENVTIIQPDPMVIALDNREDVDCHGATTATGSLIEVSVDGGAPDMTSGTPVYTYRWYRVEGGVNDILVGENTAVLADRPAGDYRVRVFDDNTCDIWSDVYPISEPATAPEITIENEVHPSAPGASDGTITISISGGTSPYSIAWENAAGVSYGTDASISGLVQDSYTVTVTDANNCQVDETIPLTDPGSALNLIIKKQTPPGPCHGAANGVIELLATGGNSANYTFTLVRQPSTTITNGSISGNFARYEDLLSGFYTAHVEDSNGVVVSIPDIDLTGPDPLVLTISDVRDAICIGQSNGSVSFDISGGDISSGDYAYSIIPGSGGIISGTTNGPGSNSTLWADNYELIVTDGTGDCTVSESFTIGEPDPITITGSKTDISCNGANNGEISINVTGGRGQYTAYTYEWFEIGDPLTPIATFNDGTTTIDGLAPGSYYVVATELATTGCRQTSETFVIEQPDAITVTTDTKDITTCAGDNSGRINVNVTGGTAPYTIDYGVSSVNGGGPNFFIDGLTANTYTITVEDDNGCEPSVVIPDLTINEPADALAISNLTADIACDGTIAGNETSGTVSFDVSGGVDKGSGFSYHVRLLNTTTSVIQTQTVDGTSTVNFSGLIAGEYEIRVRDNNADASTGCDNPIFETFTLEHIEISGNAVNATCSGEHDGEIINVEVAGASSNYTFAWATTDGFGIDDSSLDQSGLAPGTYTLTITDPDRGGCTISKDFTIENDHTLNITASVKDVSCAGGDDGAIRNVQVTGVSNPSLAIQYVWQGPGIGTITQMDDDFNFDPNLYGLEPGSYTLTVTDGNSCDVTKEFTIDEPNPITFDLTTSLDDCSPYNRSIAINNLDNSDGTGDPANFIYLWPGNVTVAADKQSISGVTEAGTYTVRVIDEAGCSHEESIDVFGEIFVDDDRTHVKCNGGNDGSIVLTITGGSGTYTYAWEDASGNPTANPTIKNQNGLTAGTYTITITDNDADQACGGTPYSVEEQFTITQPADIVIDYEKTDVSCNGNADGQITLDVTGGSGSYEYAWTPVSAPNIVQGLRKQVGLEGGIYGVEVTDASTNCQQNETIEIIEPAALDFDVTFTDTQCDGTNTITLDEASATGGFGPYEFSATGPGVPSGWTESDDFTDVEGGEYNFTLTDLGSPGNCSVTKTVILSKEISITPVVTSETCPDSNNGAIELKVTGGRSPFTFSWTDENDDPTVSPNNKNQSGLSGGTYTVEYSDDRGCIDSMDVTVLITNNIELYPSITPIICYGDSTGAISLNPAGGSGHFSFVWNGPEDFSSDQEEITNLIGGTYYVEVIDDSLEHHSITCRFVESFVVSQPSAPIAVTNVDISDVLCNGNNTGSVEVTVEGGMEDGNYNYKWSGPGDLSGQTTNQLIDVGAGNYYLNVTDGITGCVANFGPYPVGQPAQPLNIERDEMLPVTVPGGSNGAIQVNVTGGVGNYSFVWEIVNPVDGTTTPLSGTSNRHEGLSADTIRITVTDAPNGCIDSIDIQVTEPGDSLSIDFLEHKDVRPCYGEDNGEIRFQVSGGTPDMDSGSATYHIVVTRGGDEIYNDHDDFIQLLGLLQGNYHIQATDLNGITVEDSVTIEEPPFLDINIDDVVPVTCAGDNNGSIEVTVSGGRPLDNAGSLEYQLELNGPAGTSGKVTTTGSHTFNSLVAGNYTLRVWDDADGDGSYTKGTDDDDCYQTVALTVTEPEVIAHVDVVPGYETLCQGETPELLLTIENWDFSTQPDLDITLNDGTMVTVDQSPYQFTPVSVPAKGAVGYEVTSVIEIGGTCSKGEGGDFAEVIVNGRPTATIYGDGRLCPGDSRNIGVSLTGSGLFTIVYTDETNNYTLDSISGSPVTIPVSPVETTNYRLVSVSDSHCFGDTSGVATVTVDPTTAVELIAPTISAICRGDASYMDIIFDPATSGPWEVTYEEDDLTGTPINHTITVESGELTTVAGNTYYRLDVSPLVTTEYSLVSVTDTYSGNNSCSATLSGPTVRITVNEVPEAAGAISGRTFVCQVDTATYSIGPITDASSYIWTVPDSVGTINSGQSTREILIDFDADSKSGYIIVQGANGCGRGPLNRLFVNVRPAPTVGDITGPDQLCQAAKGERYSVEPIDVVSGFQWTVPEGLTIVSGQNSASIIVDVDDSTPATAGQITATPFNSCGMSTNVATHNITVNPNPVADAGGDRMICGTEIPTPGLDGNTLALGHDGQWSIVSGYAEFGDNSSPVTTLSKIAPGNLVLEWKVTDTNNTTRCYSTDQVVIRNNKLNVEANVDKSLTCDASTQIFGTRIPEHLLNTSGNWSIESGSGIFADANEAVTTVYDLAPGSNTLRWTITQNGCKSSDTVVVVNDEPDQAIIYDQDLIDLCGTDTMLTANNPIEGTGEWSVEKGRATITATNTDGNEITVTNLAKGENILRWTITKNGHCPIYDEVIIRNNMLEVTAGDDYTTCQDTATLNATPPPGGAVGQWTAKGESQGEVNFVDGTAHNTHVSGLINGKNRLYWTLYQNGCESSDSIIITSNKPTTATVGGVETICGTTVTLSGNLENTSNSESGLWSIVKGSGRFEDETQHDTDVTGVGYGENIYRWTITNGNCTSSADLKVINNQVEAYAGKDTVTCDQTIRLAADPAPAGYSGFWSVVSGNGSVTWEDPSTMPNALVKLGLGVNRLVWTVEHINSGCTSTDEVVVQVNAVGTFTAGDVQEIDGGGGQTHLDATYPPNSTTGVWSIISGGGFIDDPTNPKTQVTELEMGPNVFLWTVTVGDCSESKEVTITNGDVIQAETNPDFITCKPDAQLGANDPDNAIGRWTRGGFGSGQIVNDRDPNTMVRNLGPGPNEFVWTISYGPGTTSSTDRIVVTNNQPDEARPLGDGDHTCTGNFQLEGNEPNPDMGTVSWSIISGGGTITNPDMHTSEVTGLAQGVNTFVYTIQKGVDKVCYSTDTIEVINGTPTTPYAGEDKTLCEDSVMLQPNAPNHGTGEWTIIEGEAEFDGNMARRIGPGVNRFAWVISTKYCSLQDEVTITNNEPSEANAGDPRPVCDDFVTLSGSLPTRHSGMWTRISGSGEIQNPTEPDSEVLNLGQGENKFRWTITNGQCSDWADVIIRNDFKEAKILYLNPEPICVDTVALRANNAAPGVGTWGVIGGGGSASFDDPSNPNTVVRGLQQGENILTWSISNGNCTDVATVTIVNNSPTTADAGGNFASCDNFVTLAANTPAVGTGTWTIRNGGGDFSSDNNPTARVDNLKFGVNVFRWTIENEGCSSFDDVQVDYNSIEPEVGDDRTICSDTEVLQAGNPSPGTGAWTVAGGSSQATFDDVSDPGTTVRNLRKGVNRLRWTVNYRGCQTSTEVSITNGSPSTAYAGNTQRACADETVLDAIEPEIGTGRWEIISGSATISDSDINNPKATVTNIAKGDNVFRWVVENDICRSTDDVLVVNNLPSTPFAGGDLTVCEPYHDLMAATPEYGEGFWSIVEGGGNISDVTDPRAQIKNLSQGQIILKWTVSQGQCTLSDEIVITNNTATAANAGPDVSDCKNWAQLDANPPLQGTGDWYIVSGIGSFDNPGDESTIIRDLGFGENILMWEIWNGEGENRCFSRDTVVIFNKVPKQSWAGNNKEFCDDYTTLNANTPPEGAVGTWTVVSGAGEFDAPNSNNSIVRDIGFGNNVYKWSIAYDDCVTESSVTIRSNKTDAYAGEDVVVYDPEAMLNANNVGDLNARWNIVGGTGQFEDPAFFNTIVSGLSEGINTYRWVIDVNGCTSYDDVSVEYRPVPDAGFIVDNEDGCWPLDVLFTNYSVGVQNRDYHWDFGDGNSSGDQNPRHTFEEPGNFPVVLTVPGPDGIEGRYQKIIRVYDHPEAAFSVMPEEVYVPGDEVRFFDLSVDAMEYEWRFGDGTVTTEPHPVHEYTESGVFDVMLLVTNEFGCVDSATIEGAVTAISKGFIKFPNAFKPRPDGGSSNQASETNNIFKPVYRDVDTYQLQVYNRWGQLIYESDDIDQGWNGLYKGQLAPQAVYVWKVNGTFVNGKEFREAGSVLLVR